MAIEVQGHKCKPKSTNSKLNKQKRQSQKKSLNCPYCNKTWRSNAQLKLHIRTHTNERPFPCTYRNCGKAFKQRSDLRRHIRTHTNERPFACKYRNCGKAFKQSGSLTTHMRKHTGEKPYQCILCKKRFGH
eukprot:996745_1